MMIDLDGLERYQMDWQIEGKDGWIKAGTQHEMHEGELENALNGLRKLAHKGDTVTYRVY